MKFVTLTILILMSHSALAGEAQKKVNFHLKAAQTIQNAREAEAKVQAIRAEKKRPSPLELSSKNHPSYGLGDEDRISGYSGTDTANEVEEILTAEDRIRQEVESRNISNFEEQDQRAQEEFERMQYIEEIKRNARKRGVILEINPDTLEGRRIN